MGFACPVCGDPQADARHLANHLAFTALIRGGDHESWLEERVPDWEDLGEAALAERVTDHAAETEYPQVFEDTTDRGGDGHARDHEHGHAGDRGRGVGSADNDALDRANARAADGAFTDDASDVLAEARELTRRRHADDTDAESESDGETAGKAGADADSDGDTGAESEGDGTADAAADSETE